MKQLHDFLPFLAEFRFLLRQFLSYSELRAEQLGTTAQQYQMMQVLAHAGAGGCSVSHLAQRLLLRHNSAVELADRAERSGLVRREADQADLRRSLLTLTPAGQTMLWQLVQDHVSFFQQQGFALLLSLQQVLEQLPKTDVSLYG